MRTQPGFLHSNGSFAGSFVVPLDLSNEFNARHVIHIHNIRSNRQCGIFHDCERFGKGIFAVRQTALWESTLMRRCVAGFGFILSLATGRSGNIRWHCRFLASRPGVPQRPPRHARRPFRTQRISSGPIRVWRASCCNAESKHGRKSLYAHRDKNPNLSERLFRPARKCGCPATRRAW
jgi:hypothetical protein